MELCFVDVVLTTELDFVVEEGFVDDEVDFAVDVERVLEELFVDGFVGEEVDLDEDLVEDEIVEVGFVEDVLEDLADDDDDDIGDEVGDFVDDDADIGDEIEDLIDDDADNADDEPIDDVDSIDEIDDEWAVEAGEEEIVVGAEDEDEEAVAPLLDDREPDMDDEACGVLDGVPVDERLRVELAFTTLLEVDAVTVAIVELVLTPTTPLVAVEDTVAELVHVLLTNGVLSKLHECAAYTHPVNRFATSLA